MRRVVILILDRAVPEKYLLRLNRKDGTVVDLSDRLSDVAAAVNQETRLLRELAKQTHSLSYNQWALKHSTIAIVEAELPDGSKQLFASGNGPYVNPR